MSTLTHSTEYRGFLITPVFQYSTGAFDFEYHRISDPEDSGMMHFTRIERVKADIDFRLEERPEVYDVQISRGHVVGIEGFLEALDFARYWKVNVLAEFSDP